MPSSLFPDRSKQSVAQCSAREGVCVIAIAQLAPNARTTTFSTVEN
jgi:hypothetical protein